MADSNINGSIDFSEFIAATVDRRNLLQDAKLKVAFDMYCKDGCGFIRLDEIQVALGVGAKIEEGVWKQIIDEIDHGKDGKISLDEFKKMMLKLLDGRRL